MNERLTALDPTKVYVDYLGRKWRYVEGLWQVKVTEWAPKATADALRYVFPDLREYVPAWYEDAVANGPWVYIPSEQKLVGIRRDGSETVRVCEIEIGPFGVYTGDFGNLVKLGTLQECLDYAEPLIWKVTP